ncbi:hypothetical protein GCK72_013850 [Caenorhabditis remanei]|uniref:Uncharacterized protein n=1 Tax=Caenorhabditis remanei TaxID=31234 RepID=A0A6A5GRW6_CAERE|nr:hypothetical protein GCK72_013850 [Caenorhabditis remanei]KAF1757394.1 hypothetical protein GCK72_013850 [Caenorhabditis remanei]
MIETQKHSTKYFLFFPFIISILIYLVWFKVLHQRQVTLIENINVLNEKISNIEKSLEKYAQKFGNFDNNDFFVTEVINIKLFEKKRILLQPKHYIDTPSPFPRMVSDGILPIENSKVVAVLIESTNQNDTERLVNSIVSQRKSIKDLEIFLFTPTDESGVSFEMLKTWANSIPGVNPINETKRSTALDDVISKHGKLYAITIIDHKHIGDDFADFYYVGKLAMEADENISGVCGESNGIWQDRTMGDVLWLSDTECESGAMIHPELKSYSESPVVIRPEMARIGNSEKAVTEESSWNIDKFYPDMITTGSFDIRLNLDLERADRKMKADWRLLETFNCKNTIYTFPYENDKDLETFFPNSKAENLHKYRGILSISIAEHQCRAYIVPQHFYDKQVIELV